MHLSGLSADFQLGLELVHGPILVNSPLVFPSLEPTTDWEECGVDCAPCDEDPEL